MNELNIPLNVPRYEHISDPIGIVTGWTGIRAGGGGKMCGIKTGGGGHTDGICIKAEPIDDIFNKPCFDVKDIIFNNPATIILWIDGTKTVVKCDEFDDYDPEKGIALCFMKKALGNTGAYNNVFRDYIGYLDDDPNFIDKFAKRITKALNSVDSVYSPRRKKK